MSLSFAQMLDHARAQRDALDRLIEALEPLVASPGLVPQGPTPPRAQKAAKAKQATPRPQAALGGTAQAILDALRTHGPLSPKALATATNIDLDNIGHPLKQLREAGRITATGATSNRRYQLA